MKGRVNRKFRKNRVFEKQFQNLAEKAIETFSQSNLLSFYWGARTAEFSASVFLRRNWFTYSQKTFLLQLET